MSSTMTRPVVLVSCNSTTEHADLRPDDCPICGGKGLRPADTIEYVYCEHGHELELRWDGEEWGLEDWSPNVEPECLCWPCPVPRCDDTIILDTKPGDDQ